MPGLSAKLTSARLATETVAVHVFAISSTMASTVTPRAPKAHGLLEAHAYGQRQQWQEQVDPCRPRSEMPCL